MYGFIYLTTNKVNRRMYVGQRKYSYGCEKYLGSGRLLKKAIAKYGEENFDREILCYAMDADELNRWEYFYTCMYNAVEDPMFYNLRPGGDLPGDSESTRLLKSQNSGKRINVSLRTAVPISRCNFKAWCVANDKDYDDYDEFDSGEKQGSTRLFFYKTKKQEIPTRVKSKMFTTMKPLGWHEVNPIKRNDFKKWCDSYGVGFDDFVEVSQDEKTKWGHRLFTYYKKSK